MSDALNELGTAIAARHPQAVISAEVRNGELTLAVAPDGLVAALDHLRTDPACAFTSLIDITAVDWPARAARFDVVYHFLSMTRNQRIRIRVAVAEDQLVPSISSMFPSANWYEREVFDMYGVRFSGHPDLRRILTDYGFQGFPLRKDFPTTGYVEVRYDEVEKRVIYEPVRLSQDYRQFDFMSPWEGAKYILPGDEKKA
jgi:NADH-quinone oxidoreductase subunit C